MKLLVLLMVLLAGYPAEEQLQQVRYDFHNITNGKELDRFIDFLESVSSEQAIPYKASAIMQKAKYAVMPGSKLKYFNAGKKLLESYIKEHPENIEARYVRFIVQSQSPAFLGYRSEMDTDRQFVMEALAKSALPSDYKKLMQQTIFEITKSR